MAKPNKAHKARCERYKSRGQREINKEIKQQRHKKRMEKFAKRREKKASEPVVEKVRGDERGSNITEPLGKQYKNALPLQKNTSMLRILQNNLDREERAEKLREAKKESKK